MKTGNSTTTIPSREQITARAFQLWDEAGRPNGQDLDFWLKAEAEFLTAITKVESATTAITSGPQKTASKRKKN